MFAIVISAASRAAVVPSAGAADPSIVWVLLPVFAVFCLTVAGLMWLAKTKN